MAIHLGRPLPDASRDRPGQRFGNPLASMFSKVSPASIPTCRPYLVLLLVGFAVPLTLPPARCALTAPFHPYLLTDLGAGGLLSVALSRGLPPPGVTRHRVSVEPGLSSLAAVLTARAAIRPSGRQNVRIIGASFNKSQKAGGERIRLVVCNSSYVALLEMTLESCDCFHRGCVVAEFG